MFFTLLLGIILNGLLGILVFWSQPRRQVNQVFALLSLSSCIWLACLDVTFQITTPGYALEGIKLCNFAGYLVAVAFILLQQSLSTPGWGNLKPMTKLWLWSLPLVALLVSTPIFLPKVDIIANHIPEPEYGPGMMVYSLLSVGLLLSIVGSFFVNRGKDKSATIEYQLLFVGTLVTLIWIIACGVVIPMLTKSSITVALNPLGLVLLQLITAYGIAAKKILDPVWLVRRVASYGILVCLLLGTYAALSTLTSLFRINPLHAIAMLVLGVIVSGPFMWVSQWIARELLIPTRGTELPHLLTILAAARKESKNKEELIQRTRRILHDEFQIEDLTLLLPDTKGESACKLLEAAFEGTPSRVILTRDLDFTLKDTQAVLRLQSTPIDPHASAYLLLGPRISGQPYSSQVKTLLERLAEPLGLYWEYFQTVERNKQLYEQLRYSDRLAALGTVAANLAHEVKNPLSVIYNFAQVLRKRYDEPEVREQFSALAMEEIERLNTLLQQMTHLSKPYLPVFNPMDLTVLVLGLKPLLSSQIRSDALQFELPNTAPYNGDKESLKQAFLNILLNGIEVLKDKMSEDPAFSPRLSIQLVRNETGYQIIFNNNGGNIPEEYLPKLFDPFFSKKSNGTGLGLSITASILREHNGTISCSNTPNGVAFLITLPTH